MTMIRGSNPIWFEVDLTAHAFDDTFYLFVLENTIPYIPATVWQDPDGNVAWTNPIRFLANGTLPNNIYYDADTVYRLEFRQGPTQSDPLIYLVENYVPGVSNDIPVDTTSFSTDNQISNPQFALINFTSPLVLPSISSQVVNLAPGWFLHLTGTGSVTLTQVPLNSAVVNPTNAGYALQIQLSGSWTNAYLSQRFTNNGVLWANTFVSSSIMALADLTSISPQDISATLVDSQGNTIAPSLLMTTALSTNFDVYQGVDQLGASADTDLPPTAYIEYQLKLPNTCNLTISSIQLISGDVQIEYPYQQTTYERQIDQTYHNAFPIVPIGTVIDFAGFVVPTHYFLCDGSTKSRITYDLLYQALTTTETVTLTNSVNTFTVSSGTDYHISMAIEGSGIPASTTISNISGTTVTMSAAATASGSSLVRFFAWGNGDGSTTFTLPLLADYVTAGAGGTLFGAANNAVGLKGGAATHAITINEMPAHNHPGSTVVDGNGTPGANSVPTVTILQTPTVSVPLVIAAQGGGTLNVSGSPMSLVQQTALMKKCIRYEY